MKASRPLSVRTWFAMDLMTAGGAVATAAALFGFACPTVGDVYDALLVTWLMLLLL